MALRVAVAGMIELIDRHREEFRRAVSAQVAQRGINVCEATSGRLGLRHADAGHVEHGTELSIPVSRFHIFRADIIHGKYRASAAEGDVYQQLHRNHDTFDMAALARRRCSRFHHCGDYRGGDLDGRRGPCTGGRSADDFSRARTPHLV